MDSFFDLVECRMGIADDKENQPPVSSCSVFVFRSYQVLTVSHSEFKISGPGSWIRIPPHNLLVLIE